MNPNEAALIQEGDPAQNQDLLSTNSLVDFTTLKEVENSQTGGKTGSRAMEGSDRKKVQYKPSFLTKKGFKAKMARFFIGTNDQENFREVVAAQIRNAIVSQHNESVNAKRGSNANIIEEETEEKEINKIQELLDIKIVQSRGVGLEIASKWVTKDGVTIESQFAPKNNKTKKVV